MLAGAAAAAVPLVWMAWHWKDGLYTLYLVGVYVAIFAGLPFTLFCLLNFALSFLLRRFRKLRRFGLNGVLIGILVFVLMVLTHTAAQLAPDPSLWS
jgi:hypothetical protein